MFLSRVASIQHTESDDHSVRFSKAAKHFATRNTQNAYKKRIRETKNDCIASIYAEISHELRQHLSTSDANVLKAQGSFATNVKIEIITNELVVGDYWELFSTPSEYYEVILYSSSDFLPPLIPRHSC